MIELLEQTDEGTCRHCGGRIVRHRGDLGTDEWTHPPTGDGSRFSVPCPGAPLAQPLEPGEPPPGDQMREAITNMAKHRTAALRTDRRGWTEQQWIDDAEQLMGGIDGSVTSLVNGHVLALLARVARTRFSAPVRARLRELIDAATPGPWEAVVLGSEGYEIRADNPDNQLGKVRRRLRIARCGYEEWQTDKANAELIAAAVNVLPRLLDAAEGVADLCHWRQNRGGCQDNWTHEAFHFGNPCPYEAVAAILSGEPDPREPMPPCPLCGPGYRLGDDGCRHTGAWR